MMKTRKRITNNQKSNLNSQRLIGYVLIWIGLVRYPDKQPIHPRWKTSKRMTHRSSALGKTPSGNRRLQYLLQQRRNRTCDDCGAPDPKWASANIGVFICLKRCGVHRCLGVHISKVLPMTLDSWSDVEIDAMIEVGENASANSIYEAYIPQGISKPRPDATQKDCSKFISCTVGVTPVQSTFSSPLLRLNCIQIAIPVLDFPSSPSSSLRFWSEVDSI
ncbi:unnamed protein product [Lactuca virosa]|uniref:Arf-GAP domain-containing protein n=1 Tax=Lactuca virosa TaxID=75947 RepID=A0AAU9PLG7_9ASTR|nr:unnamed protein product [Lactuca virosa]